jgi:hypothetical protein
MGGRDAGHEDAPYRTLDLVRGETGLQISAPDAAAGAVRGDQVADDLFGDGAVDLAGLGIGDGEGSSAERGGDLGAGEVGRRL